MKKIYMKCAAVSGAVTSLLFQAATVFAIPMPTTAKDPKSIVGDQIVKAPGNVGTSDLTGLITQGINLFLGLLGLIAVIVILIGGFKWMTAGSAEEAKKARGQLIQGLIGLVVILLAWAIAFGVINLVVTNILS